MTIYLTGSEVVTNGQATSTENLLLEYIDSPSEGKRLKQSSHALESDPISSDGAISAIPVVTTNMGADDESMESADFETRIAEVEIH